MRVVSRAAAGGIILSVAAVLVVVARPAETSPQDPVSSKGGRLQAPTNAEILRLADVKPGMKGYGLSVFQGTKLEKFDVEVVSVLKKYMGDKDIIMVRCNHPVTDHANIIHGMSGSPIYLEGRLAGALSLGFHDFPKDPLAGITPIEYMLADKDHPWEDENAYLPPLPADGPLQYCRTPLFASGLPPAALSDLKQWFEPLGFLVAPGSAGTVTLDEEPQIEMGGSVGISLLTGDMDMKGIGTVSWVGGEDVLVFGHPMFQGGQIELPMTTAFIHTVIAASSHSYKLGSPVRTVGTMLKDRLTSVYGKLGKMPSMAPFSVQVENPQSRYKRTFNFEIAHHPVYTPLLLGRVPDYCLGFSEPGENKDQTIQYELTLKFEGVEPIVLRDAYHTGPTAGGGGYLMTVVQLMLNPYRKIRLERADAKVTIVHKRGTATIDGAWLETQKVKPGDTLKLTLRLRPFDKESELRTIEIPVPRTMPDGDYEIALGGGRQAGGGMDVQAMMRAMMSGRSPDQGDAQSFEELVQSILKRHPANRIVARVELPSVGIHYKDKKLANLPGSIFVNLASNSSTGVRMDRDRLDVVLDTGWVIEGGKTVRFEVRTPGQVQADPQR